jgi:hypothetical protein
MWLIRENEYKPNNNDINICFTGFRSLSTTNFLILDTTIMPTTISAEQKQELLRRLELARAAKAAKQQEKAEAKAPASKSRAKKSDSTVSKASIPTPVQPAPTPQTLQEPVGHLTSPSQPPIQPEADKSSVIMNAVENASSKTPTETLLPSTPAEIHGKTTRGKKKVCLPTESDSDSDSEEEKPKKKTKKPYATIVLHREPKKSIDKVINRLARIESSDSESSEEDEPVKPSEPIPIPQARNTRPKPPQTHSIHNQEQQRKEMLRQLALEYYG